MLFVTLILALAHQPQDDMATQFQEAKRQYDLGDFVAAARSFDTLYQKSGRAELLFDAAQSHRQAGGVDHVTKAIATYKAFLREMPATSNRAFVERMISTLSREKQPHEPGAELSEPLEDPFAVPTIAMPVKSAPRFTLPTRRWLATGIVGALVATSVVASIYTQSLYGSLRDSCGRTASCAMAQVDQLRSRAFATNVLWAVTGVAAVGAGALFYFDVSRESKNVGLAFRF